MYQLSSSRLATCSVLLLTAACTGPAAARVERHVDSLVLERTSGFSTRPAYRVSITSAGQVGFTRQAGYRDSPGPRTARDSVSPEVFQRLLRQADSSGYFGMPDSIRGDSVLCPTSRTDAASAILSVFQASATKRVDIYLGCVTAPAPPAQHVPQVSALLLLADGIDSVARTSRWLGQRR